MLNYVSFFFFMCVFFYESLMWRDMLNGQLDADYQMMPACRSTSGEMMLMKIDWWSGIEKMRSWLFFSSR